MGRRSSNYPPELRDRAVRMVAQLRPEYPSDRDGAVEVQAYAGARDARSTGTPPMGLRSRTQEPARSGRVKQVRSAWGVQGESGSCQGWSAGGEMTLEVGPIRDAASGSDPRRRGRLGQTAECAPPAPSRQVAG
jgi:hypothetical protein